MERISTTARTEKPTIKSDFHPQQITCTVNTHHTLVTYNIHVLCQSAESNITVMFNLFLSLVHPQFKKKNVADDGRELPTLLSLDERANALSHSDGMLPSLRLN